MYLKEWEYNKRGMEKAICYICNVEFVSYTCYKCDKVVCEKCSMEMCDRGDPHCTCKMECDNCVKEDIERSKRYQKMVRIDKERKEKERIDNITNRELYHLIVKLQKDVDLLRKNLNDSNYPF